MNISYKLLSIDDASLVSELESLGYPVDEAASLKTMTYRLKHAPHLFMGIFVSGNGLSSETIGEDITERSDLRTSCELIGYICSTSTKEKELTHDTMFTHDQDGETLCIHSVLVKDGFKRRGIASKAMKHYISYIQKEVTDIKRISLVSKEYLTQFYKECGFQMVGKSKVIHGKEQWYTMEINFDI